MAITSTQEPHKDSIVPVGRFIGKSVVIKYRQCQKLISINGKLRFDQQQQIPPLYLPLRKDISLTWNYNSHFLLREVWVWTIYFNKELFWQTKYINLMFGTVFLEASRGFKVTFRYARLDFEHISLLT